MFALQSIEIAIGMSLIYLSLATICSVLRERMESVLRTRAIDLERGIREMLGNDRSLTQRLYDHALISSLYKGSYMDAINPKNLNVKRGNTLPAYIPAKHFAAALLDLVLKGAASSNSMMQWQLAANSIQNPAVKSLLQTAITTAGGDIASVRKTMETWFDATMDRVTGWYKRRSLFSIPMFSTVVTLAVNANTLTMIGGTSTRCDGRWLNRRKPSRRQWSMTAHRRPTSQHRAAPKEARRARVTPWPLSAEWHFPWGGTKDGRVRVQTRYRILPCATGVPGRPGGSMSFSQSSGGC